MAHDDTLLPLKLDRTLARRHELGASPLAPELVAEPPGDELARREALSMLASMLVKEHAGKYSYFLDSAVGGALKVRSHITGESFAVMGAPAPIEMAVRLVEGDLGILVEGEVGRWKVSSAAILLPAGYHVADRVGSALPEFLDMTAEMFEANEHEFGASLEAKNRGNAARLEHLRFQGEQLGRAFDNLGDGNVVFLSDLFFQVVRRPSHAWKAVISIQHPMGLPSHRPYGINFDAQHMGIHQERSSFRKLHVSGAVFVAINTATRHIQDLNTHGLGRPMFAIQRCTEDET
ncbi:hypothetical protein BDY21DRAFT_388918 [Lineolata rhizophorae]|uniref:Uncharacterized protein n=1 Tax=Lineolata rhizophorae TaxID=578093 RepID=A0A6A6PDB2_9PEZI|nr:hypothetical protein BDY21DRAFT_388918 [Lineolata rhizophorae]